MNRARRSARRRGFTMVELVVAVALLGIGVTACVACLGTATRASTRAEELTAVQLLAREKLAELETSGAPEGEDHGDFGPDREGFAWQTVTEATPTSGLRRVQLRVLWGDEEHPRTAEFVTYVRVR